MQNNLNTYLLQCHSSSYLDLFTFADQNAAELTPVKTLEN